MNGKQKGIKKEKKQPRNFILPVIGPVIFPLAGSGSVPVAVTVAVAVSVCPDDKLGKVGTRTKDILTSPSDNANLNIGVSLLAK